jgi:preprotein translocase subunit SecB
MSDTPANTNGLGDALGQQEGPTLLVNLQFLKDFSFENPRAPDTMLNPPVGQPEVTADVDVQPRQLGGDLYEVLLALKVTTKVNGEVVFLAEVQYGAVVTIRNAPPDVLAGLILVETPRLLFPFARNVIADATREGGYPALLLGPVDFAELHRRKAEAFQAQQAAEPEGNA